ncbi:MAG: MogA/MoaB family molybdenum cofactor biosynthesis protein [Tissierellia bacterium]|nr:MogA/MoaB family molybdenum cofactor biosynthesis protein [Tissierellia bacterium]
MFRTFLLIVSDSASQDRSLDQTTEALMKVLPASYEVVGRDILPDCPEAIAQKLIELCDGGEVDLILTSGGTGFSPRDHTPEATKAVIEREAPGLAMQICLTGLTKTPRAALSRGLAGIRGKCLIINLPGSPKGAVESLESVLGILDHGLQLLLDKEGDCANTRGGNR